MTVHVKGDLTRSMKPGDHVVITGVYLPQPVMRRGRMFATTLLQTTVLHATAVDQLKESYTEHVVTDEVRPPPATLILASGPAMCGMWAPGLARQLSAGQSDNTLWGLQTLSTDTVVSLTSCH